jgi:hypothetical protein
MSETATALTSQLRLSVFGGTLPRNVILRLIIALNYARDHPECINQIGAMWTTEPGKFLLNIGIHANFVRKTTGLLRKSLRAENFEMAKPTNDDRQSLMRNLHDSRNWKLCSHPTKVLTSEMNEQDCVAFTREARGGLAMLSWLGDEDGRNAAGIIRSAGHAQMFEQQIENLALKIWQESFQDTPSVKVQDAIEKLFPNAHQQISLNFKHLWGTKCSLEEQYKEEIGFVLFLRLFLIYGSESGLLQGLLEISPTTLENSYWPKFKRGFGMGTSQEQVLSGLKQSEDGSWVAVEGSIPGRFQIFVKQQLSATDETLAKIEITVNPVSERKRFTCGKMSAVVWTDLIDSLKLNRDLALEYDENGLMARQEGTSESYKSPGSFDQESDFESSKRWLFNQ